MHDFHGHLRNGPPADDAEQGQQNAGENVAAFRAAMGQQGVSRPGHVLVGRVVADHLQREVGLDCGADVQIAAVEQGPAAVSALDTAQIDPDLPLELGGVRLAEIGAQQDVFGRDGGVGLQFEQPVAVGALPASQGARGAIDRGVEVDSEGQLESVVHGAALFAPNARGANRADVR